MVELKKRASPAFFAESAVCHEQTAKRFFRFFRKRQAVCACKICSCSHLYMAMRQDIAYLIMRGVRIWALLTCGKTSPLSRPENRARQVYFSCRSPATDA